MSGPGGGCDGYLSDSSCSDVSGLSLRGEVSVGQLQNTNLNLSQSSTSSDAHDPKTLEILRLRAENAGLKKRLREIQDSDDDGIFTEKVVSRKHASIFFRAGRFFVQDENSSHGTMVNGERIQKGSSYKLSDGDILSLGRSGTYKGVEFKAIIGKLSLGFPAYDSVVPNSLDQLPMVDEEEGKEAKPLDRTLSLESLIKVIEEEKNKTPRTERRLAGLKEALRLQEASNLSTQEAVSLVSDLGLSPPNSPGRSLSH